MCKKCSRSVDPKTELFTVCEGDCACSFHATCVGLSERDVIALSSLNIIWLCDECMGRFRRMRDGIRSDSSAVEPVNSETNKKSIEDEISELKDAVAGIMNTLAKCVPTDSSIEPPLLHSTPVPSSKLLDGTNACGSIVNNEECEIDDDDFSLLLTNIDVSVAECDVHRMVAQALGIGTLHPESIDVVKLVPHWKNRKTMDYVSFKVVMENRWRSKAMNPSTWPKGVKFREFIRRHNSTWKPDF